MRDEKASRRRDGETVGRGDGESGRRGEVMSLRTSAPLNFTSSPRLSLSPSPRPPVPPVSPSVLHRCSVPRLLCVVALTVKKAEVLFAKFGVGDLDLEL